MKRIMASIVLLSLVLSCASLRERLAIKECKFALLSVTPHTFTFSNLQLDFDIKVDNPNSVDAVLDKLVYTFYANNADVFSGTTGKTLNIKARDSEQFTTTITLEYTKIGQALVEAMKLGSAAYRIGARAYVSTVLGEISYPVEIELN
ncbi:LEA type 2 family protein [candidate division WOR-3 bacterium]|nr:LEA type 2 family protein [candidate division WOR-3 bacterium]